MRAHVKEGVFAFCSRREAIWTPSERQNNRGRDAPAPTFRCHVDQHARIARLPVVYDDPQGWSQLAKGDGKSTNDPKHSDWHVLLALPSLYCDVCGACHGRLHCSRDMGDCPPGQTLPLLPVSNFAWYRTLSSLVFGAKLSIISLDHGELMLENLSVSWRELLKDTSIYSVVSRKHVHVNKQC